MIHNFILKYKTFRIILSFEKREIFSHFNNFPIYSSYKEQLTILIIKKKKYWLNLQKLKPI